MKKYLLSLLITFCLLIGFSSASSISTTCNQRGCSVCDYTTSNYCCFNVPSKTQQVIISWPSSSPLSLNGSNWKDYNLPLVLDYSDTLVPCIAYKMYKYSSVNYDYNIEFVPSPTIPWWRDWLTPAINWLKGTVFELIPYVVFIWIWMLLATIWFYAIRRLVNWLIWKINSNFKSKR